MLLVAAVCKGQWPILSWRIRRPCPSRVHSATLLGYAATLPVGIAVIDRGEALPDGMAVAVSLERFLELALLQQHVADLLVRNRQIAPPPGIGRISGDATLANARLSR